MIAWNRSKDGRRTSSETARKTSSRPEVQTRRARVLRRWRRMHPDEVATITHALLTSANRHRSAMEESVAGPLATAGFERQVRLEFEGGVSKVVDFVHRSAQVALEVDGRYHFEPLRGREKTLRRAQVSDRRFDEAAVAAGWRVVRLGMSCFTGRGKPKFNPLMIIPWLLHPRAERLRCVGDLYRSLTWGTLSPRIFGTVEDALAVLPPASFDVDP